MIHHDGRPIGRPATHITHSRVVVLSLIAGAGALTGCYSQRTFTEELPAAYCEALFACYDRLEADCGEVACLYADEKSCKQEIGSFYKDDAGACAQGERFDAGEASQCIDDLGGASCEGLTAGALPKPCGLTCG
jgi:hypothetical protein